MNIDLHGKTALVTGGTAGIGLAIATSLARDGARVFITGREPEKLGVAVAAARAQVDGEIIGVLANAATEGGTSAILSRLPASDILVNNLGMYDVRPFQIIDDDTWRRFDGAATPTII